MHKTKTQYILLVIVIALAAFFGGAYLGYKNNAEANQNVNVIPKDLQGKVDMTEFWEVWRTIEERHPQGLDVTPEQKVWGAIKGLTDSVGDPYTVFLTPKENEALNVDLKGKFSGVGMEVGMKEEGLTVIAPLKDSPAEKAGILAGDIILKIGDTVASGLDIDQAVDLIRGKAGTTVTVTIFRKGEKDAREITITRQVINIPVSETKYLKDQGVFVISLFNFGEDSQKEFAKGLQEFTNSGSKKLIIDLRNNPGGFLSSAVDIASWFLEPGSTIVTEKSKDPKEDKTYKSGGHFMQGKYKVVVLVNGGSASASEILAGALQEHHIAKLVGTQTFGKGSVQELLPMEEDTALKITIAQWLTPNGVSISKQGLTPDVVVELDKDKYLKDGTDTQLQKAIEILNQK